jgi:hypothetical protein
LVCVGKRCDSKEFHTNSKWDPKPSQAVELENGDIYAVNGLIFSPYARALLSVNGLTDDMHNGIFEAGWWNVQDQVRPKNIYDTLLLDVVCTERELG